MLYVRNDEASNTCPCSVTSLEIQPFNSDQTDLTCLALRNPNRRKTKTDNQQNFSAETLRRCEAILRGWGEKMEQIWRCSHLLSLHGSRWSSFDLKFPTEELKLIPGGRYLNKLFSLELTFNSSTFHPARETSKLGASW